MKRGRSEGNRVGEAARKFGSQIVSLLQWHCDDEFGYWARCKRSALLWDWIAGTPIETLEKTYSTNPFQGVVNYGDVIRIADATRFHLRSAHQILAILLTEHPDFVRALDTLLVRLEFGLPEAAIPLTELPVPLIRGQYLALWEAGCVAPDQVGKLDGAQLTACVGAIIAQRLRDAARK